MSARVIAIRPPARVAPLAMFALGCATLATRQWSMRSLVAIALVGATGLLARAGVSAGVREGAGPRRVVVVVVMGCAAFAAVRALSSAPSIVPFSAFALGANVFAAVCEEAFFRRFAYGHLERFGTAVAVGVTSVAFAVVHIPLYGVEVFWLDLGAGLVFGWQRWASGGWGAPAATHAVANILMMR